MPDSGGSADKAPFTLPPIAGGQVSEPRATSGGTMEGAWEDAKAKVEDIV